MNKRKKITQKLVKKAKKANEKNRMSNKPRYVCKADREAALKAEVAAAAGDHSDKRSAQSAEF